MRLMLWPVVYSQHRFDATSYLRPMGEDFNNLFGLVACLCKAECWQYEKEWRFLAPFGGDGKKGITISMPRPSRVLLGARMSHEDAATVRSVAESKEIAMVQMRLAGDTYDLVSEKLDAEPARPL